MKSMQIVLCVMKTFLYKTLPSESKGMDWKKLCDEIKR